MLKCILELCEDEFEMSGFELGNITFILEENQITSKSKNPDQAMMLFLTIPYLLDEVRKIFTNAKIKKTTVPAIDSSYTITLEKSKKGVRISDNYSSLNYVIKENLIRELYVASTELWKRYKEKISSSSVIYDYEKAVKKFEQAFGLYQ